MANMPSSNAKFRTTLVGLQFSLSAYRFHHPWKETDAEPENTEERDTVGKRLEKREKLNELQKIKETREMREVKEMMFPHQWTSPCGNQCTQKYSILTQLPWRVFCKKGCIADGDTWDECVSACDQICYKDPVFKDQQWSAYIDRSPGAAAYSEECFHACVSGCGFKFEVPLKTVEDCKPKRPNPSPVAKKPTPEPVEPRPSTDDDMPSTSA
ncbi:hypothetical protein Dimus_035208 [Dionaea muscipula]